MLTRGVEFCEGNNYVIVERMIFCHLRNASQACRGFWPDSPHTSLSPPWLLQTRCMSDRAMRYTNDTLEIIVNALATRLVSLGAQSGGYLVETPRIPTSKFR